MRWICGFCLTVSIGALALLPRGAVGAQEEPGKALFAQCSVCHSIDGSNGVGPSLRGIYGRKAGASPGFRYSRAMRTSDLIWNEKNLDRYLTDPQTVLPGNVMPFAGLRDAKLRAGLVAYLLTLK